MRGCLYVCITLTRTLTTLPSPTYAGSGTNFTIDAKRCFGKCVSKLAKFVKKSADVFFPNGRNFLNI